MLFPFFLRPHEYSPPLSLSWAPSLPQYLLGAHAHKSIFLAHYQLLILFNMSFLLVHDKDLPFACHRRDQALVAQAVRKYLHQYSIPQREVVEKTGINQSHLSQHFTRGVPIKPAKRIKLYHWFEQDQVQRTGSKCPKLACIHHSCAICTVCINMMQISFAHSIFFPIVLCKLAISLCLQSNAYLEICYQ